MKAPRKCRGLFWLPPVPLKGELRSGELFPAQISFYEIL
jgi:hypothetical protein